MERRPSKADQLRALREAGTVKKSRGGVEGHAGSRKHPEKTGRKPDGASSSPAGIKPGPRDDTEDYRRWCKIIADIPSPAKLESGEAATQRTVNAPTAGSNPASPAKRKKAANGTFDKAKYQRELMRKRRAVEKANREYIG